MTALFITCQKPGENIIHVFSKEETDQTQLKKM